jgi:hypothetical protein
MPAPFPLYLPPDARRLFQTESLLRRFAQMAQWDEQSRLLELHASLGGLALIRALGSALVIIEPEQKLVDSVRERAKVAGVLEKVTFEQHSALDLDYPDQSFSGIFGFGRVLGVPGKVAAWLRPLLTQNGRLGITCMMKVSRNPAKASLDYWNKRLGSPLLLPRESLLAVEAAGYEPELVESLGDAELEEYYKELEAGLSKSPATDAAGAAALKEEIAVHRAAQGKAGVTFGFIVARRKEPGEKPPLSRDSG